VKQYMARLPKSQRSSDGAVNSRANSNTAQRDEDSTIDHASMQAKLETAQAVIEIQEKRIEAQRRNEQDLASRLEACTTKLSKAESEKRELEERFREVGGIIDRLSRRALSFSTSSVSFECLSTSSKEKLTRRRAPLLLVSVVARPRCTVKMRTNVTPLTTITAVENPHRREVWGQAYRQHLMEQSPRDPIVHPSPVNCQQNQR
jgi:hypothetical protein